MTKIISFINLKGGVGKTTTAVALAEFLAKHHQKRVLLVDLDPQTNATTALISEYKWKERDDAGQTLYQLFMDKLLSTSKFDINKAILSGVSTLQGGIDRLSLLPSSLGLIEIQDRLVLIPSVSDHSVNPVDILYEALQPVLANYDYILIDCPPNLGIITQNGINMSTGYVIPVIPDILSTYGIPQILNRIDNFRTKHSLPIQAKGIIVSKFRVQNGLHVSRLAELRREAAEGKPPPIFDEVIPEATHISQSVDPNAYFSTLKQKYRDQYEVYLRLSNEFLWRC